MRLLFLSTVYPTPYESTKGVFNQNLVDSLARDHQVRVVAPVPWPQAWGLSGPREPLTLPDPRASFPTYYYTPKVLRGWYGHFLWHSVRSSVRTLLASLPPDAVIGYWAHPDGEVAVRAAREAKAAALVIVGGSDVLLLAQETRRRAAIMRVLHSADAVLAVGRDLRERLLEMGLPAAKVHVLDRGVDRSRFAPGDAAGARAKLGLPANGPILLWVGRMVPVKGLGVLMDACERLSACGQPYLLCLVGDGPLRRQLQARVAASTIAQRVRFFGAVPHADLPDFFRGADLTVLPSLSEGVPNVLLESVACGTPFVASRVGGVSELAGDPDRELVVPGDPSVLADALLRFLRRPWRAKAPQGASDAAASVITAIESARSARQQGEPRPANGGSPLAAGR